MNEIFLQLRVNDIHADRLREAEAARLAREARAARDARPATADARHGILGRLLRGPGQPAGRPA